MGVLMCVGEWGWMKRSRGHLSQGVVLCPDKVPLPACLLGTSMLSVSLTELGYATSVSCPAFRPIRMK